MAKGQACGGAADPETALCGRHPSAARWCNMGRVLAPGTRVHVHAQARANTRTHARARRVANSRAVPGNTRVCHGVDAAEVVRFQRHERAGEGEGDGVAGPERKRAQPGGLVPGGMASRVCWWGGERAGVRALAPLPTELMREGSVAA